MDAMNWPALVSCLKDVTLGVAGAVTATVAVRGLQKWRDEIKGKADFDIARGLARATYKVRDEIQSCRSPLIRASEYPPGYQAPIGGHPPNARVEAEAIAHVFKNRWQYVAAALQEFDSQALEAEALWGRDIRESTQVLRGCAHTLYVAIDAIIDDRAAGGAHFEGDREFGRSMRANAYASPSATDNALSNEIAGAVTDLERRLRGHLTRGEARKKGWRLNSSNGWLQGAVFFVLGTLVGWYFAYQGMLDARHQARITTTILTAMEEQGQVTLVRDANGEITGGRVVQLSGGAVTHSTATGDLTTGPDPGSTAKH